MKKVKLFCFPYAGGSSNIYEKWRKLLLPSIELINIEYPGRGIRFTEPLLDNIDDLVNDVFNFMIKHIDVTTSYSFFGHSMGSIIAYEIMHKLDKLNYSNPVHVFFSGKLAPHIENEFTPIHNLSNVEFKEQLLKLGGTTKETLDNNDWAKLFLPVLRADFKAVEKYSYLKPLLNFFCDFTILHGQDDPLTLNRIEEWQYHTLGKCNFSQFSGDHFFINEYPSEITDIINNTITAKL